MLSTPPVTKNLIIINGIMYFALIVGGRWGIDLNEALGLHFIFAPSFQPYQLLTYMFMHAGIWHIFCNMFTLWMFGRVVESTLGSKRFLWFYLLCGLGAGLSQEIVQVISYFAQGLNKYQMVNLGVNSIPMAEYLNSWTTIGASGACYGVLIAYGMLFPNERVMLLIPPIPMKAKYMVIGFIIIDLLAALGAPGDGVAHCAHLGGALVGFLILLFIRRKERQNNSGFTSWEEYRPPKKSFMERLHDFFHSSNNSKQNSAKNKKQDNQEEIDRILEKIKRSGYDSLTEEEKIKLFNSRK